MGYSDSVSTVSDIDYDWTGKLLIDKYILVKRIGYGAYSSVWLSFDKDKKFYAIKINNCEDYKEGSKESVILNNLKLNNSENTIRVIETFDILNYRQLYENASEDSEYEDMHHCIVLELMACSCYDLLKSNKYKNGFSLDVCKKIIKSVLLGIKDLNEIGYVHTDIKPDNILIGGENIKFKPLIDFIKINYENLLKETKLSLLNKKNKVKTNHKELNTISIEKTIKHILTMFDKKDDKIITESEETFSALSEGYESDEDIYRFNKTYLQLSLSEINKKEEDNNSRYDDKYEYINLENLENIKFKLSDFGTCYKIDKISHSIQTRYYRAPEVILKSEINEKCDIWSLGCTFYELLYNELLFNPDDKTELGIDKYHLYYIQSKLGVINKEIINQSPIKDLFFKQNYSLKGIKTFEINLIYEKIFNDYGEDISIFLYKCFLYEIKKRGSINELLKIIQ